MPMKIDDRPIRTLGALASLHAVADDLLARPDAALDDALNAAAACFARHGLAHTSVRDIAAELGVSTATVYRQVGSVDVVAGAVLAREAHGLVEVVVDAVGNSTGPGAVLDLIIAAAVHICGNPLVRKVLRDEPVLLADLLPHLPKITGAIRAVLTTVVEDLRPNASGGSPAPVVADVAVRMVLAAVLDPPPDLPTLVQDALRPHLGI